MVSASGPQLASVSAVETVRSGRRPPNRDRFVTRLIPLRVIKASAIVEVLKPLVSKDAVMAAYLRTGLKPDSPAPSVRRLHPV